MQENSNEVLLNDLFINYLLRVKGLTLGEAMLTKSIFQATAILHRDKLKIEDTFNLIEDILLSLNKNINPEDLKRWAMLMAQDPKKASDLVIDFVKNGKVPIF